MDRAGLEVMPAQVARHVGLGIEPVGLVDMVGGVERFQPLDLDLQLIGQRIVGRAHVREQRVAPVRRQLARDEDGAHRRDLVIGMVGVPRPADIGHLVGLLADDRDLGILVLQGEVVVDVDPAPTLGKGDVIFGRELLVAKHRDAMFVDRLPDRIHLRVAARCERNAGNFDPAFRPHRRHLHGHIRSPFLFPPATICQPIDESSRFRRASASIGLQCSIAGARRAPALPG